MKIAYTTTFDAQDVHNWSGTPYYMSQAFSASGAQVHYLGNLQRKLPPLFKLKQTWHKFVSQQRESPRFNIYAAQNYSQQIQDKLKKHDVDVIVSPLINPIAYLQTDKPIVLWTDAVYASLLGFYPPFAYHSARTIEQGNIITAECLSRCRLAIFSSTWAANNAMELYGVDRNKVKVVPFGANIQDAPSLTEVKSMIANRAPDKIKLLFLAKSWERKGGDVVLKVAQALHAARVPVELTIVGYKSAAIPQADYIKCLGFISKHSAEGRKRLRQLLADSHFLFVPSRAEAYGIVFCEANAFGIPCLTTYVGGIGTIIQNNHNGMTFSLHADIQTYCDYIINLMADRTAYETMALNAYQEYSARLNWQAAVASVKQLIGS